MTAWTIDQAHSEIAFKVKHLVISTVTGNFRSFQGSIMSESADFSDATIRFTADINSISTGNEQRDGHLKSPDFFDAAAHPTMSFESVSFVKKSDDVYDLTGNLTIRGVTRPVRLGVVYNGTVKGFEGNVAAFEITGSINRQDFGLRWNALTESGGVVVSDIVKLDMVVELKQVEVEEPVEA